MEAQNPNEIFDVVDANDRVVGQATRADVHARKLFHRAVHIFVFTPRGTAILQRRSLEKDTCPGLISTSCAGHVDAGESYDAAAYRELQEELGIDLAQSAFTLRYIGMQTPSAENGYEFVRIYALPAFTGTLRINPAETETLEFFSRDALNAAIRENPKDFAPSFVSAWNLLFAHGLERIL